jgi:DNA-binding response OmpR family regulator
MARILLVEDDMAYANLFCDCLGSDFAVEVTGTIEEAQSFLAVYEYELLVIDWHLPDADGPSFIDNLRARGVTTPILMLTARGSLSDKEHGFTSGADDYLTKSADPREISMRVKALLRRPASYMHKQLRVREIEIDVNKHTVTKNGEPVHLLPKEFAVLEHLVRYPNRVFTADELMERLWPADTEATIHTVRSCINKLRTKLDDKGSASIIQTKYGAGYQLSDA